MPKPQVKLYVGGRIYEGWLGFTVSRTLEAPAGTFSLAISDKWPGRLRLPNGQLSAGGQMGGAAAPWPIKAGDQCRLELAGETIIDGWVDETDYRLTATERSLAVSGRDKTGDLVDCSYVEKPNQWQGADVQTISRALAQPFGVQVKTEGGGNIKNFKVEPGETAGEAIARLCKLKGLLAYPGSGGRLTLAPAGGQSLGITLKESDCLSISIRDSQIERFSDYQVKGQRPTVEAGKDAEKAKEDSQNQDKAQDQGVKRYRPLLLLSEGPGAEARERALWEAAARAGQGLEVEIKLPFYTPPGGGALWPLNRLIKVQSPGLSLEGELLIKGTTFELSAEGGHTTTLTLSRPDAYKPEPIQDKGGKGGAGLDGYSEVT